jgi:hypothetical protein
MNTTSYEQVEKLAYATPVLNELGSLKSETLSIDTTAGSDVSSV